MSVKTRNHNHFDMLLRVVACLLFATLSAQAATLISWWKGEGDTGDSISANNGFFQIGVTYAPGRIGQGFSFNGTNSHIRVHQTSNLEPGTGSFALLAWIMTTNGVGWHTVIGQYELGGFARPDPAPFSLYWLSVVDGKLRGDLRDTDAGGDITDPTVNGGEKLVGTNSVADGRFHHIALVRDMAQLQMRLYLDGVLEASTNLDAGANGSIGDNDGEDDPIFIGAGENTGNTDPILFFSGIIDEVQYWAGALSQQEILNASRAFWVDASLIGPYAAINLRGATGHTYRIDYVDALGVSNNWITATNFTMTSSPHVWTDSETPNVSKRFFRVVQLP
jgi:hypothetical protein